MVRLLRSTSWTLLALLLVSAGGSVHGQDAGVQRPHTFVVTPPRSLPDGADEGASDQRMVLPDLPAAVDLDPHPDVTGSIAPDRPVAAVVVPPPLPFDEAPAAALSPAPAPPATAALSDAPPPVEPVAPPIAPPSSSSPPAVADGSSGPTTAAPGPTAVPVPLVATPEPSEPKPALAAAPGGLDAASLGAALAGFADDTPKSGSVAQIAERHAQREAIAVFYAAQGRQPLWVAGAALTPAARSVLARLDHAAEDGLDVTRYAVPVPRDSETASLATAELAISEAVVAYAREASGGRIDIAKLGGVIDLRPTVADAATVLAAVPGAPDAGEALRGYNPPHPGYAALRDKLAELRRQGNGDTAASQIPPGPVLKPGMRDARVPLIRARFGLDVAADDPASPTLVYDTRVAAAVAAFQRAHGLPASGLLTSRTIAALSGGNPTALENDIIANMELWRWLPRDLGADRVEVNIPDYTARVVRDGVVTHETRVVVGQPDKQTPVFAEQMKFIIVNPYWNVPLSIIKKEMMPKLASDPSYFADHGYEVVERDGITYVRQPPGDGNALGRIKFMFPNTHSVYLHDTNARSYFARDMRALSHGCVRVEQPFSFAEAVMGRDNGWPEARIKKLIGGKERTINLPKPLPIFITYFTAFVDAQAGFQLRDDIYSYAAKVKLALGLQG